MKKKKQKRSGKRIENYKATNYCDVIADEDKTTKAKDYDKKRSALKRPR